MSNYEYDRLYDELLGLEQELGTTLGSSPTVNVGYEVLSELPKERHAVSYTHLDVYKRQTCSFPMIGVKCWCQIISARSAIVWISSSVVACSICIVIISQ